MANPSILRRDFLLTASAGLIFPEITGCTYNPEIERSQLILISDEELAQLGNAAWADLKTKRKIVTAAEYTRAMNRVCPKIIGASDDQAAEWEWAVFEDDDVNAFALPGNKIGVYTGMIDFIANDDQLATIIGHEVAHVHLRHAAERYSQQVAAQSAAGIVQIAAGSPQAGAILGAGATYGVLLPYSRKHELEADRIGVRYQFGAGYDPEEAITFWERMLTREDAKPPAILSTHPSDEARLEALRAEVASLSAP